jgi:GGDEF domain-containing protein
VQHLEPEDRDFLLFLLRLEEDEFQMILNSMTQEDAMRVLVMIQQAKDEIFDDEMEAVGMVESGQLIRKIKSNLNKS